jgi:hypothetical protein
MFEFDQVEKRALFVIYDAIPLDDGALTALRFHTSEAAAKYCAENGFDIFYEMDEGGPFLERPVMVYRVKIDAVDSAKFSVISINYSKFQAQSELVQTHDHKADKLARDVLKRVSRMSGRPYKEVTADFKSGDFYITRRFWLLLNAERPGKYSGVNYCYGCKKFCLFETISN